MPVVCKHTTEASGLHTHNTDQWTIETQHTSFDRRHTTHVSRL